MRLVTEGNRLSNKVLLLFLLIGSVITLLIEFDHWQRGPVIRELNYFLYDTYIKNLNNIEVSNKIVIVDIDEKSLQQVGQWPWPRYRLGHLIQAIEKMQPAAIGLDVLMPEPDRTALSSIKRGFNRDFGLNIEITGVPPDLIDNDEYLGQILRDTSTVPAHYFLFDHITANNDCRHKTVEVIGETAGVDFFEAPGLLCNTDKLLIPQRLSGFINTLDDEDGILRRLPVFIKYDDKLYPNLAVAAVMKALSLDIVKLDSDSLGTVAQIGEHRLPIDRDGSTLLRYPGPAKKYRYLSALDILQEKVAQQSILGKIVFIGSSAAGLYDFHHTIYDPNYPGVETLAVAAGNILENSFVRQPAWGDMLSLFLSLATAVGVTFLFVYVTKPAQAVVGILLLLTVILGGSALIFSIFRVFLPVASPLVAACLLFTLFSVIRYGIEQRASFLWYQKMARSQQVTLESMATVVETRDYETGGHIKRTQHFVRILARQLAESGLYSTTLTPDFIQLLFISAPLHDIGKVGVPDQILLKPGPLDVEEFEEMKKHTEYGRNILLNSGRRLGGDNFLELAREIAESHHEKWDGSGYPLGLAGEEIPLAGRIMMVADVYDALTSKRCYKPAYSHAKAREILIEGKGTFFDPKVIEAFFDREEEIVAVSEEIKDLEN